MDNRVQDTFLLGLGPAGREVLIQVAAALHDRFGRDWPANIHMLQVDVLPEEATGQIDKPDGVPPENWILLRPNLRQMEENLRKKPEDWPHWQWYTRTAPDYERARGRLAFFYDVRSGINGSLLWKAIQNGVRDLNAPAIRVIGTTFDDVSSGMLVDVLRLIQIVCAGPDGTPPAQLWLAGPVGRDWSERLGGRGKVRADEQKARTLATLRELERFQRNAPVEYRYILDARRQEELYHSYNFALVNEILLFEPTTNPPVSPENDSFVCMANALLALLDVRANQEWNRHLGGERRKKDDLANLKGQGAVLTVGCYTVRRPAHALTQALAWRMVRDVLFETTLGLLPVEQQESNGDYRPLPETEQGQPLKSIPAPKMQDIESFLYKYRSYFDSAAFAEAVRHRVNDLLNGEQDVDLPATVRRAGLAQAIRWLKLLSAGLKQNDAIDIARHVDDLSRQLNEWQRWLKEQVYPICKQHFEAARLELQRLRNQPAQSWGIEAGLEWPLYRRYLRAWAGSPSGSAQSEPLLRLTERFGWEVEIVPNGWRARLIVPPGEFDESLNARNLDWVRSYEYALTGADVENLLQAIFSLARRAARLDAQTTATQIALQQNSQTWLERARAKLRLRYDDDKAAQIIPQSSVHLLITPELAEDTDKLTKRLLDAPNKPTQLQVCQNDDPTSVTLIEATTWIPLPTIALYDEETWESTPVPPMLYVWPPEQMAAELEREHRLSPLLVSRIAEDEPLLRAFGLAFIYQAMGQDDRGWRIPGMDDSVSGDLAAALNAVFEGDAKAHASRLVVLQAAVEQRRQAITDRRFFLRQVDREQLQPLKTNANARMQDLVEYLRGLIAWEMNG